MTQYGGSDRARQEQERRQREFRERMRNPLQRQAMQNNNNSESEYYFEYSEWLMRRIAPFALLIHVATILFLISWFIVAQTSSVSSTLTSKNSVYFHKGEMIEFEAPKGGAIYNIAVQQDFPFDKAPLYSEFEVEIVDANYDHVYTVYKDFWQESHPNGDGGTNIYHDSALSFDLELEKAGTYYIRGISHNNNEGLVSAKVSKKVSGTLYFRFYSYLFGILSLLLLIGFMKWGSPSMMYHALPKLRSWKENTGFLRAATLVILLFFGTWFISLTHYGYASSGDEIILPTYFYKTNTVIYLG